MRQKAELTCDLKNDSSTFKNLLTFVKYVQKRELEENQDVKYFSNRQIG